MRCPKCNNICEEFSPICEECSYIFEYSDYRFIHEYVEKYSKITVKSHNTSDNNAKIIFKNISTGKEYSELFNNISPEEYTIDYYKQKGYNAFFAENEYWAILLTLIYFPEQNDEIRRIKALTSVGWIRYSDLKTDELNVNAIYNISNLNNRIMNTYFKSLQIKINDSNQNPCITYSLSRGDGINFDELMVASTHFTINQLKLIFERICDDIGHYIYGLPDLIVYNDEEIFFVEVKSKDDSPNFKQIQWHKYISEIVGINVIIFMIDKTEKQINNLKQKYDVELLNSENRKIFVKKLSSEGIFVDWSKIESKYPDFQISDRDFKKFYSSQKICENCDSKKIWGKYTRLHSKDFGSVKKWLKYINSLKDDLLYKNAPRLYQDNSFLDFRPNKKQLKRNNDAKLLEEKGEYSKAIELYMKNAEEKCGSPITYKRLISILIMFNKWNDISKILDFIIPIFIKLNDKTNTIYFIHQRWDVYQRFNHLHE